MHAERTRRAGECHRAGAPQASFAANSGHRHSRARRAGRCDPVFARILGGQFKTDVFCAKALSWTEGNELTVLEVSDYGTKGLNGADGERNGSWFGLVQSGGVSINQDDAGGAFGIGKKAPFAGSFARTVFYSTLNRSGGRAFQGVTTLTTHLDATGEKTQGAGFIGLVEAEAARCGSVRDPEQIPESFRRLSPSARLTIQEVPPRPLGRFTEVHGRN